MDSISEVNVLLESKNQTDILKAKDILAKVSSSELKQLITQKTSEFPTVSKILKKYIFVIFFLLYISILMCMSRFMDVWKIANLMILIVSYPLMNLGSRLARSFQDQSRIRLFVEVLTERKNAEDIPITLYVKSWIAQMTYRGDGSIELQRSLTRLLVSQSETSIQQGYVTQLTAEEKKRIILIIRGYSDPVIPPSDVILLKLIEIIGSPVELPFLGKLLSQLQSHLCVPSRKCLIPATIQCISSIKSRASDYQDRDTLLRSSEDSNLLLQSSSASTPHHQLLQPSSEQLLPSECDLK